MVIRPGGVCKIGLIWKYNLDLPYEPLPFFFLEWLVVAHNLEATTSLFWWKNLVYTWPKETILRREKSRIYLFSRKICFGWRDCSYVQNAEPYYSCPSINPSAQSVWSSNSLQSAEFARYSQIKICPRTFVREGHLDPSLPRRCAHSLTVL